jgi:hypothetical protein
MSDVWALTPDPSSRGSASSAVSPSSPPTSTTTAGPQPAQQVQGILAYLEDEDCAALAADQPDRLLGRRMVMLADGRLAPSGAPGRPVQPSLFLGRSPEGRLTYLCTPLVR